MSVITVPDAAALLGVRPVRVEQIVAAGQLVASGDGGLLESDVRAYAQRRGIRVQPSPTSGRGRYGSPMTESQPAPATTEVPVELPAKVTTTTEVAATPETAAPEQLVDVPDPTVVTPKE